jgi:hypothetical protein
MWKKFKQDFKERFLWIENLGYIILIVSGVLGLLFPQYTFHLVWLDAIFFGMYRTIKNPIKQAIKFEEMVEVRKDLEHK